MRRIRRFSPWDKNSICATHQVNFETNAALNGVKTASGFIKGTSAKDHGKENGKKNNSDRSFALLMKASCFWPA